MSHAPYELKAETRERVGKGSSRELRRNGLIPAVIYGDKKAPLSIALSTKEVTQRIHAGGFMTTVATIDVNGEKISVLPKDYQLDPVRDFTMHVDFLRVSADSKVTVQVPQSTAIKLNREQVRLGHLKAGDHVRISIAAPGSTVTPESR